MSREDGFWIVIKGIGLWLLARGALDLLATLQTAIFIKQAGSGGPLAMNFLQSIFVGVAGFYLLYDGRHVRTLAGATVRWPWEKQEDADDDGDS